MRILFLSHNRSGSSDAYNYRLRKLCDLLNERGLSSEMRYLGDAPLGRPTALHALKIRRVKGIDRADVVHAGSAAAAFAAAFLPNKDSPRIVFDMHGDTVAEHELAVRRRFDPSGALRVLQERWRERWGLRRADRLIVVSEPLRMHAVDLGFDADRIAVVRNGVDLELFRPAGDPPGGGGKPLVVYAGRFDGWQGVEILLRLAAAAGERFRLRIIGFTAEDRSIRQKLAPFEEKGVELIDRVGQTELLALLREGDALLIPRESHPATEVAMPTKFAEYLALGRPVLLTRVGEPAALVEEAGCGIVTDPSAEGVLEGIGRLAGADGDARRRMGAAARRLAEEMFDWNAIAGEYARFLKRMVGER